MAMVISTDINMRLHEMPTAILVLVVELVDMDCMEGMGCMEAMDLMEDTGTEDGVTKYQ
jgi:hypothetical protein